MSKRIFIIDDEPDFLVLLEISLKEKGYEVFKFENSEKALKAISESPPDAIITDVYIEQPTSGIELCKKLNKLDYNIPTIVLTGLEREYLKKHHDELMADVIMRKPFDNKELIFEIERITHG